MIADSKAELCRRVHGLDMNAATKVENVNASFCCKLYATEMVGRVADRAVLSRWAGYIEFTLWHGFIATCAYSGFMRYKSDQQHHSAQSTARRKNVNRSTDASNICFLTKFIDLIHGCFGSHCRSLGIIRTRMGKNNRAGTGNHQASSVGV